MTTKSKIYLLPFILLDEAYDLYNKHVAPMKCKFELNKYKKEWSKAYQKLNKALFAHNDADMVIDMMDSLEEEVHNTFVSFRSQVKDMLPSNLDSADLLAAIYTYIVIVEFANSSHCVIYNRRSKDLDLIQYWASRFLSKLFIDSGCGESVDPNKNAECQSLCESVWNSLTEWIT